jgi:cell division protein FtsB
VALEIVQRTEQIKKMDATDMILLTLVASLILSYFTKNTEMWNPLITYIRNQEIGKENT